MSTPETEPAKNTDTSIAEEAVETTAETEPEKVETGTKKTSWYPLALALLLIAVIVVAVSFFASRTAPTPEERLETTQPYTEVAEAVTLTADAKPGQVLLAPATKEWWEKVLRFGRDTAQLNTLAFEEYQAGAEYVAFALSPGADYVQPSGFGLPTFMIAYETPEQATAASEKIIFDQAESETETSVKFHVRDRLIIFTPPGANSDLDYPAEQFEQGEAEAERSEEDLFAGGTKAVWQFNFKEIRQILLAHSDEEDRMAYDQVLSALNVTDAASFLGTSEDLLEWDGRFYNLNLSSVPNPEAVMQVLRSFLRLGTNDGGTISPDDLSENPELEETLSGQIFSGLSELAFYTQLSARTQADGSMVNYLTGEAIEAEILPASEGLFRLRIAPNIWTGYLTGRDEDVPVSYFADATVTILDGDGNATIKFTDFEEVRQAMEENATKSPEPVPAPAETTSAEEEPVEG